MVEEMEKKKEEENKKEEELDIIEQGEQAVQAAENLLEGFDGIFTDNDKRQKATYGSGAVVGAGVNYFLDAAVEKDEKKKTEQLHKGGITLLEIFSGIGKVIIAGQRRRNRK